VKPSSKLTADAMQDRIARIGGTELDVVRVNAPPNAPCQRSLWPLASIVGYTTPANPRS